MLGFNVLSLLNSCSAHAKLIPFYLQISLMEVAVLRPWSSKGCTCLTVTDTSLLLLPAHRLHGGACAA